MKGEPKRAVHEDHPKEGRLSLLASIVEFSADAIITMTADGTITSWNRGAERVYGYTEAEVMGRPVSILLPSGRADELPEIMSRVAKGESTHLETARVRKDGQLIKVFMSISPIRDVNGRVVGASTIARDITDDIQARRTSEERLEAASQYARSLIEASLDPLVTISPDGKITDVNEATVNVTGVTRERLIGTDFSDYFTEPEKARDGYQRAFSEGFVKDYPLTIRHLGGKLVNVLYNASLYRDARGNVLGVFAAARDVTAQKKAEAELAEQRRRELERLADLEKFQRLTVGRELKMVELKKEIEDLRSEIEELKRKSKEHDNS
jgi:PAS domain S-box-containing protein